MNDDVPSIVEFSSDVSSAEQPPALPVGNYKAIIRGATKKLSQSSKYYAETLFFINPDQYPVDFTAGSPDGMTIAYRRLSLEDTPNGRFQVRQFCQAIGAPMAKQIDLNDWINREAVVEVIHETYEGVTRAAIKRVRAA